MFLLMGIAITFPILIVDDRERGRLEWFIYLGSGRLGESRGEFSSTP
jgi:hypothetical protein